MPTVSDYPDAVQRIVESDVPADATTAAEVQAAIAAAGGPQINAQDTNGRTVGDNIADVVLTEDRVLDAIESSGELPSEAELGAVASAADDYDMSDRVEAVTNEVSQRVATIEEVNQAVDQARQSDRPTFREDVESAVDELASRQEFVGESPGEVAGEQARDVGAPRRASFERAATQAVATGDQVTPADVVEGTSAKTPVSVIRDASGDAVAATGGPSDDIGRQVAESIGAEYMSTEEVTESMDTEGTGSTVDLTLRGRRIGEVSVE